MVRGFVFALACLALGHEGCVWDANTELHQGLSPISINAGASFIDRLPGVSDQACQNLCCENQDCQIAYVELHSDGNITCFLIQCMYEGNDVCTPFDSTLFRLYRKVPTTTTSYTSTSTITTTTTPPTTPTTEVSDVRSANSTDHCHYNQAVGPCRASFIRFCYNILKQSCENFTYGGCGGNANNFNSHEECWASCAGVTGDVVPDPEASPKKPRMVGLENEEALPSDDALPEMTADEFAEKCEAAPQVGLCRASMPRFYYDNGACKMFKYGGCGGNQNRYISEEECMATCTVKVVGKKSDVDYEESCVAAPDPGPCRAAFQKFYFDSDTLSCQVFIYGGCKGNKNRYNTLDECRSKCAGDDGGFGHNKGRAHWTPAIFLMATLTIISIVLLVGMILIATRRVRRQQLLALDDRQELLPEDQLSEDDPPKAVIH